MQPSSDNTAAAIVVFAGDGRRIERGYRLAEQNGSSTLIISPANIELLKKYEMKFGTSDEASYLIEDKADTTLTNAYFIAELLNNYQLNSALLVTSDYHMPRSYLLLKLLTLTKDCDIGIHKVETRYSAPQNWKERMNSLKIAWNEMVQLWGSMVEGGVLLVNGNRKCFMSHSSNWLRWFREHLFFKVQ